MLLPDNIHPEQSIYYNGAVVLQIMQKRGAIGLLDLYGEVRSSLEMSMPVLILCLDWLYLLELVTINEHGRVELCT